MAPKKKDEEPPPPEELLAKQGGGFSIGGEVYWVQLTKELENGVELKPGMKGTLEALGDLTEEMTIDLVSVKFENFDEQQTVPLSSLSINPPPLELLDTLTTGLKLPLRGIDVEKIWALGEGSFDKQSELIMQLLDLRERYGTGRREIVCDFHLYNLIHAKSLCMTTGQGAVFHAIMDKMLSMMRNPDAKHEMRPNDMCTAEQCFKSFQQLILAHARQDPPDCLGVFRDSEVRLLTDFASVTLFKHYLLYQYCINFDREIETLRFNPHLERPSAPPELALGTLKKAERKVKDPENGHHADREFNQEASSDMEEREEPTEEEKIEQLVQEKLRETEDKLLARLEQRETDFMTRLDGTADPKKKPK